MTEKAAFTLREAGVADAPALHRLVRALAAYERLEHRCVSDAAVLSAALDGERPRVRALLAERSGEAVGFALWYETFHTFAGRHGYWLEDLFVLPEARGAGIARALLTALAKRLHAENGTGISWNVLDWNEPAQNFYRAIGADMAGREWRTMHLSEAAMARLAK